MTALPVEPQTMADVERAREAHLRLRAMPCAPQAPERPRPRAVRGVGLPVGRIHWELPRQPRPEEALSPAHDEADDAELAEHDSMDAQDPVHDDGMDALGLIEADLVEAPPPRAKATAAQTDEEHQGERRRVSIDLIIRTVAEHSYITVHDLMSNRRTHNIVMPRQVVMFLAKDMTLFSLPSIGRLMGGRDHTTILHAVRKVERIMRVDHQFAENVERLKAEILRRAGA